MVEALARRAAAVGLGGTCMEARSVAEESLVPGSHRSTLEELADWTCGPNELVVFWRGGSQRTSAHSLECARERS